MQCYLVSNVQFTQELWTSESDPGKTCFITLYYFSLKKKPHTHTHSDTHGNRTPVLYL